MIEGSIENAKKLAKNDAVEAISNLNSQDQTTKQMLLEMLREGLIEIHRSFDNPQEVKVSLTNRGSQILSTPTF